MRRVLRDRELLGVSCMLLPVPRPESTASWNCVRPSSASCVYTVFLTLAHHEISDPAAEQHSGCMVTCCRRATFKALPLVTHLHRLDGVSTKASSAVTLLNTAVEVSGQLGPQAGMCTCSVI